LSRLSSGWGYGWAS